VIRRVVTAAAGVAMAAFVLTGCLGTSPEPTPTPTGVFASEEEAFAAAEETYRAYVDAENKRWADPRSAPDPQSFLIGDALERDIDSRQEADQLGLHIEGESEVVSVSPVSADLTTGRAVVRACVDSTHARVMNQAGEDVTLPDRDETVLAEIHLTRVDNAFLIEELRGVVSEEC
jgi:hypothetical protein